MRKLAFCICENKNADQLRGNREADQRLCFRYGLFQKKILGGGRRQAIYFSMGGRCAHFSNYMGPWCLTNSDYIGGGVLPIISNSVGGCIAFAASRRGKNIICKSVDKCCHKKA